MFSTQLLALNYLTYPDVVLTSKLSSFDSSTGVGGTDTFYNSSQICYIILAYYSVTLSEKTGSFLRYALEPSAP